MKRGTWIVLGLFAGIAIAAIAARIKERYEDCDPDHLADRIEDSLDRLEGMAVNHDGAAS